MIGFLAGFMVGGTFGVMMMALIIGGKSDI